MGLNRAMADKSFWEGKRVFLTGHTGFKGSWLSLWLQDMGSEVKGYSLDPPTEPNLFNEAEVGKKMVSEIGDIRDLQKIRKSITKFKPDIIIHMAAQPLVRYSYENPLETYSTNVIGTANVLESARKCSSVKAIVSVTTDKCYENKEWLWGYRENEPLGGHDPYSSSKAGAELVTSAYRKSFFNTNETANIASVRAGNVIGGGDWAQNRLIPDILRAFEKEIPVVIRNPLSIRPWQHVLEPLSGYLILAEKLFDEGDKFAEAWNFGPKDEDCKPVEWILEKITLKWGNKASWKLDENSNPHEAGYLKLDCSKAAHKLNWHPYWNLEKTLDLIVEWHKDWASGKNMQEKCLQEIKNYCKN